MIYMRAQFSVEPLKVVMLIHQAINLLTDVNTIQ